MRYFPFALALCMLTCGFAMGDDGSDVANVASDALLPLVGYALYDTLSSDDSTEREMGHRLVYALAITGAMAWLGKQTISSRRPAPNLDQADGMPSGHSALAFAAATVLAERNALNAPLAYGLAGLMAWSRSETHRHHADQIIIGSALGYLVGRQAAIGEWHIYSDGGREDLSRGVAGSGHCGAPAGPSLIYSAAF